jgi:predicted AlkP superfamily phosphohydrolase/phosphomutase
MSDPSKPKISRRTLLKRAALAAGAAGATSFWPGCSSRSSRSGGKKVIVIGIDGMDPRLSESMMQEGLLPNLQKLRAAGGFSPLGTSVPPQSPVAWANFINGAGPGSHGIFDFIHRHPQKPTELFYSAAETIPGEGTVLRRQGVPFWDFLDGAGVPSTFYDLPCNYPPSPSHHGHHRCIAGMGTPDMLGSYGTYQLFSEDGPADTLAEAGGRPSTLNFEAETARASLVGPQDSRSIEPRPVLIEFLVHRDRDAKAVVIEIQGRRLLLREGEWSRWTKLDFDVFPWYDTTSNPTGICRFYVQEVAPNCKIYVSPVNIDPANPAKQISEPDSFIKDVSAELGPFYTAGFQEDYEARKHGVFSDDEFITQADYVLKERLALFEHAINNYDDGLLFFYFSSSDLQSHILWWNSDEEHPIRPPAEARARFQHVRRLYQRLDHVIGEKIVNPYGSQATIIVMSDHGFANFGRQFNLNSWLRANGYLGPSECTSIMHDVDWSRTAAYGLGLNGLYLNLKGREPGGIIEPGEPRDALLNQLAAGLEAVVDENGQRVIRGVYRADRIYSGNATALAPDLIIGYTRGYRASWATVQGDLTDQILLDNDSAWSADHCADALEVPGVLFSNRPIRSASPSLVDVAPSILAEFGLSTPSSMVGRNIL